MEYLFLLIRCFSVLLFIKVLCVKLPKYLGEELEMLHMECVVKLSLAGMATEMT